MADGDQEPPPPSPRSPIWGQLPSDEPTPHRNNVLYERNHVLLDQPPATPEQIDALFAEVQRNLAAAQSSFDRLRDALKATPARGIGDNQGPRLEDLEDVDNHLLALLKDQSSRPPPAERPLIIEQAEEGLRSADRIKAWLATLAEEGAKLGAREVAKDLTKPLWADVAHKLAELCHSVIAWIHALGTLL